MSADTRIVMVTGASTGIGRATALGFAARGYQVGVVARRLERLERLAHMAHDLPGAIIPYMADVTEPEGLQKAVDNLLFRFGRLDVLIANAGIGHRGPVVGAHWADLETVLRTNIDGVLHSVRAAVPAMRRHKEGHIVLISSVVSVAVTPYATVYAATKAAVNALARGLRCELTRDNIWVTSVLVGQTVSDFAESRLGIAGKVTTLPTMPTEYVARRIVECAQRRRRTVTLRWLDRALVAAGMFVPWLFDRLATRIYRTD